MLGHSITLIFLFFNHFEVLFVVDHLDERLSHLLSFRANLIRRGRLFQSLGPAVTKARSPRFFKSRSSTTSRQRSLDLNVLEEVYGWSRSVRY